MLVPNSVVVVDTTHLPDDVDAEDGDDKAVDEDGSGKKVKT